MASLETMSRLEDSAMCSVSKAVVFQIKKLELPERSRLEESTGLERLFETLDRKQRDTREAQAQTHERRQERAEG